jgi:hypothetical protein
MSELHSWPYQLTLFFLTPQDASDKIRELHASEALCFCRRIGANRPAPRLAI